MHTAIHIFLCVCMLIFAEGKIQIRLITNKLKSGVCAW